jgi:hypothetical protein
MWQTIYKIAKMGFYFQKTANSVDLVHRNRHKAPAMTNSKMAECHLLYIRSEMR